MLAGVALMSFVIGKFAPKRPAPWNDGRGYFRRTLPVWVFIAGGSALMYVLIHFYGPNGAAQVFGAVLILCGIVSIFSSSSK